MTRRTESVRGASAICWSAWRSSSAWHPSSLSPAPPPAGAVTNDQDQDGLDDSLEDTLAVAVLPVALVRLRRGRRLHRRRPSPGEPGRLRLARVRRTPGRPRARSAVHYVILFRARTAATSTAYRWPPRRCRAVLPSPLRPNPACPHGYGAFSLKTVAHFERRPAPSTPTNACSATAAPGGGSPAAPPRRAKIYASENKHGNYASDAAATLRSSIGPGRRTTARRASRSPFNVTNVGEPNAPLINEHRQRGGFPLGVRLVAVPPSPAAGTRGRNAGLIRDKWIQDRLLAIGVNPPPSLPLQPTSHGLVPDTGQRHRSSQGQQLLVIAAGCSPTGGAVQVRPSQEISYFQTRWANDNVIDEEYRADLVGPGHVPGVRGVRGTGQHRRRRLADRPPPHPRRDRLADCAAPATGHAPGPGRL